jgi:hypothetical protein
VKYSRINIGKYLADSFANQNCPKQIDALSPQLFNFALEYAFRNPGKPGGGGAGNEWDTSASGLLLVI